MPLNLIWGFFFFMSGEWKGTEVVVHPLVLLSSVDHFTRLYGVSSLSLQADKRRRVVGVLLGMTKTTLKGTTINVTNSYAGMD